MFKIGDEVVCISDTNQMYPILVKGNTYIIRDIREKTGGLFLVGIHLPVTTAYGEVAHQKIRFTKVDWTEHVQIIMTSITR